MRKVLLVLLFGMFWSNTSFAECIEGDCKNGQGTYVSKGGKKYVGGWLKGKKHGQGTYVYKDGKKYVGGWLKGKQHGQGILTSTKGYKYVGEFKDGKYHGQGTYTSTKGYKYVGEFKNFKYHGQGTYTWISGDLAGDKYVGEWRNKKFHGHGTYTYADGRVEKGNWKKGKLVRSKEDEGIAKAQSVCKKVGFTPGTEKFADCTIKMLTEVQSKGGSQTVVVGQRQLPPVKCSIMWTANC